MSEKYSLEELAGLPEFYHPAASPDDEKIAFYWDKSGRNELYVLDKETRNIIQISEGEVPKNARWPIIWHPDGDEVFFHKDEAGDEQNDIHMIDMEGSISKIIEIDGQCLINDVSDDCAHVLFTCDRDGQRNLYLYNAREEKIEKLTDYDNPVCCSAFRPDGKKIAYAANETDDMDNGDIYLCDVHGTDKKRLDLSEVGFRTLPQEWSPDGRELLIQDHSKDKDRIGIYDVEESEVLWIGSNDFVEYPACFTPDGEEVLGIRMKKAERQPIILRRDGTEEKLKLMDGVCAYPRYRRPKYDRRNIFTSSDSFILAYSTSNERKELLEYDLSERDYEVLIEAEYSGIEPEIFVEAEYVTYESEDDLTIDALLYDSGERPSPAIVMVHGGPFAQAMKRFDVYTQFLVKEGYTVLKPNYRGSIGRGREFRQKIKMDYGGKEQQDIANAGRWLKDKEWIDEDRIAVFGGSYGGYSVYMQMVKYPKLWTTGIAWVGITDLNKLYEDGESPLQYDLKQTMGDPEQNYELWRERSPIEHVGNMERPILMIHGVNDPRCPVEQARIFKEALEEMGWEEDEDFEYEELSEEGHGSTDISQKIRVFKILEDYLKRRL